MKDIQRLHFATKTRFVYAIAPIFSFLLVSDVLRSRKNERERKKKPMGCDRHRVIYTIAFSFEKKKKVRSRSVRAIRIM